jgi:hypothetical protein
MLKWQSTAKNFEKFDHTKKNMVHAALKVTTFKKERSFQASDNKR